MNKMIKTLVLVALSCLAAPASNASDTESQRDVLKPIALKFNNEFAANRTYEWTSLGDGVKHVSKLTERATEPEQIKALITLIYTNPDFPGKKYSSPVEGDDYNRGKVGYNRTVPDWGFSYTTPPNNDDEEQTMLVVEVKDNYPTEAECQKKYPNDKVCQLMYQYIKSVKVLTEGFRIKREGQGYDASNTTYNPGVVYNVSGTYNRFFVMGKGAYSRGNSGEKPFYQMFEEYSPRILSTGVTPKGFYEKVTKGESFKVSHECTSVPFNLDHWVTMGTDASNAGQTISNLNVFIPDFRFIKWNLRHNNGGYSSYNEKYAPTFNAYALTLTAEAKQQGDAEDHKYEVTLSWTSGLDKLSDSKVMQDFYIYRVVNGVIEDTPLNTTATHDYSYSYTEPQNPSGHGITYIVTGKPTGVDFSHVESNKASVIIPGWDPYERLSLNIGGSYSSSYDPKKEQNDYKNTIILNNTVGTNVTGDLIEENATEFVVYRFDNGDGTSATAADAPADMTPISIIKFGAAEQNGDNYDFHYTVTPENQAGEAQAREGVFTAPSRNGEIDFGNFSITDVFSASTAHNAHKAHYDYKVVFKPAKAIAAEELKDVYSNVVRINVYKTDYTAKLNPYTESDYLADTDHSLSLAKSVTVTAATANASEVRSYAMYRQDGNGTVKFADIQRTKNGNYSCLVRNTDNDKLDLSIASNLPAGSATVYDDLRQSSQDEGTYYPVITAIAPDNSENTYGANHTTLDLLGVRLSGISTIKSNPFVSDDDSWKMGFSTVFEADGLYNGSLMKPVSFRVWRVNSDNSETMLTPDLFAGNTNPNVTNNYLFSESADHGQLQVKDLFIGDVLNNNSKKTVNYIVRFYCRGNGSNSADYYVSERKFSVTFSQNTVTGLSTVSSNEQVQSVRYYNLQGMESDSAFSGLNIVVTTYTNGRTTTEKRMF